ncbi:MAG: aminotransferase class I/II-fold pyridoxal phosphate-dependent enzyme [Clostridiales bacterium]|nr:aminotransferase class I/II-fold pyridoxal phosphate-dependent enzyme [Clostridiales bacterium]
MKEKQMPLVEALFEYIKKDITRYHMPGHKGGQGFSSEILDNLAQIDVTEVPGLDNLHSPQGAIYDAQRLASKAFGSDQTWFLVNGSTSGIHAMILAACPPGSSLIVPRNCHKSVVNALIIGDISPVYILPKYDKDRELVTQVSPQAIEEALGRNPNVQGVLLVSPNYYGMCPSVEEIAHIVHRAGKVLLVDEAHGAHFPFNPRLPSSAGQLGADLWVHSAHKTLPSFTQTAYLHLKGNRVDKDRVSRILSMNQTSSPSYIFMASLDWARYVMDTKGHDLLYNLMDNLENVRHQLKEMGIDNISKSIWPEVRALDPTRLVLDFKGLGLTGYQAEKILRDEEGLQLEMSDHRYGVLICTVADTRSDLQKIVQACQNLWEKHRKNVNIHFPMSISREIPKQMMSPRQAFYSKIQKIPLKESQGRIAAGTIGAYPLGIPRYCPGELIEKDGIEELISIHKKGGTLFGVDQGNYIDVVEE